VSVDPTIERIMRELRSRGFDLCGVASTQLHDVEVARPHRLGSSDGEDRLVIVVGHSRGWWRGCLDQLESDPALLDLRDPIEEVAQRMLGGALLSSAAGEWLADGRWRVRYAHERFPPSMRRLAVQAGLASFGPAGFGAHARWGPWIAFRAAIVTHWPPPILQTPTPGPCEGCSGPCGPAMKAAHQAFPIPVGATRLPQEGWRAYANARATCPVGEDARYDPCQLEYHYTHAPKVLRRAVDQRRRCASKKSKTRSSI